MRMSFVKYVLGFALCAVIALAGPAHATVGKCQRTLLKEFVTYHNKTIQALRKCEDKIVTGKPGYPLGTDCRVDTFTAAKIATREAKFRQHVRSACGGKNKTCNAADTGDDADESLAAIGWNIGTCPDFEASGGCGMAIADCGDITDCLECISIAAQDQALTLYYDALALPTSDRTLNNCQRTVGERSIFFFRKKLNELSKCERKVLSGSLPGPCPDTKTAAKITLFDSKIRAKICKRCGGDDKICGGTGDFTPTQIGFTGTCPNVTIPGGAACSGTISTLSNLVDCVACVTEFKADCLETLSAPTLKTYPAECQVAP